MLALFGYEKCADGRKEVGVEKIAIYADGGVPTHAAKQKENGLWTSKLGPDEDIEHALEGLEGPCYGKVVAFFCKGATPPGCLTGLFISLIKRKK